MFKKLIVILFVMFLTIPAFADSGKLVLDGDTLKSVSVSTVNVVNWEANMTDQMKSVPFTCLQKAYQDGKALCDLGKELATVKWGVPIVKVNKHSSQEIKFSENSFHFEKTQTKEASSEERGLFVFWVIIPFLCILLISLINGYEKIQRKNLLIFYLALISIVIFSSFTGGMAGRFAGILAGAFAGIFAGTLVGLFAGRFEGMFIGGFVSIFAGIFAGVLASVFYNLGYGFWNSLERAMIPEYLSFLLVTFLIGFVLREIAFQIAQRKTQEVQEASV